VVTYSLDVCCNACKTSLLVAATLEEAPRRKTSFAVPCPGCHRDVLGEIPIAVNDSSVQVVWYERP
jgi:hypothetical protein